MTNYSHRALRIALPIVVAFACAELAPVKGRRAPRAEVKAEGTLSAIREKRRMVLVVVRRSVVEAGGSEESIVSDALGAKARDARRHPYPYATIARKLNEYMRKYRGMTAVDVPAEADYIIYFNLLEYRRFLNGRYPYGELFVILNRMPDDAESPRIIWKTSKVMWAEDAVKEFLKELKRVRGQR